MVYAKPSFQPDATQIIKVALKPLEIAKEALAILRMTPRLTQPSETVKIDIKLLEKTTRTMRGS